MVRVNTRIDYGYNSCAGVAWIRGRSVWELNHLGCRLRYISFRNCGAVICHRSGVREGFRKISRGISEAREQVYDIWNLAYRAHVVAQFRAAVTLKPDYQNARYNLARALIKAGKLDEAVEKAYVRKLGLQNG